MSSTKVHEAVKSLYTRRYRCSKSDVLNQRLNLKRTVPLVEWSILNVLDRQGFHLDPVLDNKSVSSPDELYPRLAKYSFVPKFKPLDDRAFGRAVDLAYRAFGGKSFPLLDVLPLSTILWKTIRGSQASSLPYFETKASAFVKDLEIARRVNSRTKAPLPCVAYRRVQHGDNGPKVRLVWGFPQSQTLLEARFAAPLIERFLNFRNPIAFGLNKMSLAGRMQRLRNSGVKYGFDFSGFDTSIHPKLIVHAFKILGTHFRMNEEEASCYDRVIHYFIHTPIVMPNGNIYTKHHGVPSGSYFTQLVDSIVNFIAVQYATIRLTGVPVDIDKILVLGDDSIIGLHSYTDVHLWKQAFSELGLNMSLEKSGIFRGNEDVYFLGHSWHGGFPSRREEEIAKRLCFPEQWSSIVDPGERNLVRLLAFVADSIEGHNMFLRVVQRSGVSMAAIYGFGQSIEVSVGLSAGRKATETNTYDSPRSMFDIATMALYL